MLDYCDDRIEKIFVVAVCWDVVEFSSRMNRLIKKNGKHVRESLKSQVFAHLKVRGMDIYFFESLVCFQVYVDVRCDDLQLTFTNLFQLTCPLSVLYSFISFDISIARKGQKVNI